MKLLLRIVIVALTVFMLPQLVPGISVSSFFVALMVALVLAVINVTLKPVLFLLTLPVTILSLGLFAFVLNALLLMLVSAVVPGFVVGGFFAALVGSLIISVVTTAIGHVLKKHS